MYTEASVLIVLKIPLLAPKRSVESPYKGVHNMA